MHPALLVDEILLNILATLWKEDRSYSHLNAVARTCRFLSPLALDFLWSELSDPQPLLQYLNQHMSDDPSSSFHRAASRIRKLSCPPLPSAIGNYSQIFLTQRLQRLSLIRTTTPLLPNLRQLSWTDTEPSRYVYIQLFLSPALESFQLDFSFHKHHHFPFLASLPKLCPSLHRISLNRHSVISSTGYDCSSDDDPSAVRTICRLPRLTTLEFHSSTISQADLLHLSRLQSLTTLSLGMPSWISVEDLALRRGTPAKDYANRSWFRNLRKLHLRAYSVPMVTSFIEPGCMFLQAIVFNISEAPTTASLTECFRTLRFSQRDNSCSAMRQIKICDSLSDAILSTTQLPSSRVITLDVFKPLFAFTKLQSFILGVCLSVSLSDSDLSAMAGSWPELEVFCLNEGRGWRTSTRPSITIRGLESLCALCPRLHRIALVINALDLCPPQSLHAARQDRRVVRNLVVTHLSLGDSWLAKPHDVAIALSDILPRLKRISAWQHPLDALPGGQHYRKLWEEVNSLLQLRSSTLDN